MKYIITTLLVISSLNFHAFAATRAETLELMSHYKWVGITDHQKDIFIIAMLETWSFILYSYEDQANTSGAEFSDSTACAASEKPNHFWRLEGLAIPPQTMAEFLMEMIGIVCKPYVGKGDGKWYPVRIMSRNIWDEFDLYDKSIYISGYIELAHNLSTLSKLGKAEMIRNCIAGVGIERVLSEVEKSAIQWQYALPWSIAPAVSIPRQSRGL